MLRFHNSTLRFSAVISLEKLNATFTIAPRTPCAIFPLGWQAYQESDCGQGND